MKNEGYRDLFCCFSHLTFALEEQYKVQLGSHSATAIQGAFLHPSKENQENTTGKIAIEGLKF